MTCLGDRADGRDNNFNLIRMAAATGVLVSHAWPIALGPGALQPMKVSTGYTLGTICVQIFFVISGFLIAASFMRSRHWMRFLLARALRLFPGLVVSIVLVGLVMAPLVTTLSPASYFTAPETWTFLLRNITLAFPQYTLPGVFEANPYTTVEGSIWTLIHEVACYMGVFLAGLLGILARRALASVVLAVALMLWIAVPVFDVPLPGKVMAFHGLALPFAIGTAAWLWRDRLVLSLPIAGILWLIWWGAFQTLPDTPLTALLFSMTLAYSTFWLGYVPGGLLHAYNRLGDYSYGMYIYAFPLQGLAVWIWGMQGPGMNILLALPPTLLISILSWHLVEKPSLDSLKPTLARILPSQKAS